MNWLTVLRLIPQILMLLKLAEDTFTDAKAGKVKKDFVTQSLTLMFSILVSVGVMKREEADSFLEALSPLIDEVIAVLNSVGVFKHS